MTDREVMEYDVVIVGAGPAGLACAIRLKQLQPDKNICVLEKASSVGAHSLSGAVLEPAALEKLLPNWRSEYSGMKVPAAEDDVRLMTKTGSLKLPGWAIKLSPMHNHGNFIISLGQLTPWLAQQAEKLGVDIFPGFSVAEALFDEQGAVKGVRIGDMGLNKDGTPGPNYTPGVEIHAGTTILAEGSRGSISKQLIAKFNLREGVDPPTFGLGLKELWQLPPGRVKPGR
ncbi:MAG TPA: NAD(P)/FAD-dependent oxidoreductase, partial [Steroidobacteraceae bacterium]|nr:NAD(P)/FAD-dependent oxidoreductase [Steroidobacteraceae bacterium]